jgi:integrase
MSIERRQTKSGKVYDVRLRSARGRQYKRTFRTKKAAQEFDAQERTARLQGQWIDPRGGRALLRDYAKSWLIGRASLRPRTIELYRSLLDNHILPPLGEVQLAKLSTAVIRSWHATLLRKGRPGSVTVAKCYRLLRTILGTATEDGIIARNPCVIKGAAVEHSEERAVATLFDIEIMAASVPPRYRAMILLGTFTGLRYGELAGLQRQHVNLHTGTVTVVLQLQELSNGECLLGPPKTAAGRRTITIPPHILGDLGDHLTAFVGDEPTAMIFTSPEGTPLRRSNFRRRCGIRPVRPPVFPLCISTISGIPAIRWPHPLALAPKSS